MWSQAIESIIVGVVISVIGFIPYLVFQYRRYGRFSASRMIWMATMLVYLAGLVTYTLFPLPGPDWCAVAHQRLVLNPMVYVQQMWADYQAGASVSAVLTSWTSMQQALNVLLFLPLGVILRHLWKVGVARITLIGFCASLLIEATQYTGNWFIAPCPYRLADTNDLMTNTLGALLGGLLARLTPRLAADADAMEATRGLPKPVTRGRRYAGMLLDLTTQLLTLVVVYVFGTVAYVIYVGLSNAGGEVASFSTVLARIADLCQLGVVVVFALVGSGASVGQRLVYLAPMPAKSPARYWLFLRAMITQGVAVAIWLWWSFFLAVLWLIVAVVWVLVRPRGLSFQLTDCDLVDARSAPPTGEQEAV